MLVILANLFAPIFVYAENDGASSVPPNSEIDPSTNPDPTKTKEADNTTKVVGDYNLQLRADIKKNDVSVSGTITIVPGSDTYQSSIGFVAYLFMEITLKDEKGTVIETQIKSIAKSSLEDGATFTFEKNITPETPYVLSAEIIERSSDGNDSPSETKTVAILAPINFTTSPKGATKLVDEGSMSVDINKESGSMPPCSLNPLSYSGTAMGCVAQAFYYVLFVPTSYLFALTGVFFDNTFAYSVQDSSYRSAFVVQGWGLVRDFCNIFFIFILLYIAISTILNIHGFKTKETIINVVIIGLFINFSLFATQVIIDASNITARVFYNSDAIKITEKGANGVTNATPGLREEAGGVIPLSAALVNKVNPQNLIINSKKINSKVAPINGEDPSNINVGSFIIIVLLASAVNIVGMIVFASVGLIFIARVIGLWVAMIMAPLAFFTYAAPSMSKTKMIGWENWWPETFKLAFLAPVFIFFLYIILKFLELDLLSDIKGEDGLSFFVAILIPFAFIMILMLKAKDIAKDMSGEMGQKITGAVAAGGGMLLGGAALGGAMLGRKAIAGTIARASRGDTNTQAYTTAERLKRRGDTSAWDKLSWHQKATGWAGKQVGLNSVFGKTVIDPDGNKIVRGGIGKTINDKQKEVGEIDHARHKEDELKKAAGLEGVENDKLTGNDEKTMANKFRETERSATETAVRKGFDAKGKQVKIDEGGPYESTGEEEFKSKARKDVRDGIMGAPGSADRATAVANKLVTSNAPNATLTKLGEEKLRNELNMKLNAAVKIAADKKLGKDYAHMRENAAKHVNPVDRVAAGANRGTYDIRKLSDLKSDKREGLFSKIPTALIAGVAMGVRTGIKKTNMSNGTIKVEGNFMKDLSNTITDSLKSANVTVDLKGVGEHKSSADPHGGHH